MRRPGYPRLVQRRSSSNPPWGAATAAHRVTPPHSTAATPRTRPLRRDLLLWCALTLTTLGMGELLARTLFEPAPAYEQRRFQGLRRGDGPVELQAYPLRRGARTRDPRLSAELLPGETFRLLYHAPEDEGVALQPAPGFERFGDWLGLDVPVSPSGTRGPGPAETKTKLRVACVGDSFTFGDGVPLEACFVSRLAELRPDLELVNYGVPGYDAQDVAGSVEVRALPEGADVVLWSVVLNDVPRRVAGTRERRLRTVEAFEAAFAPPTGVGRWSRMASVVQGALRKSRMKRTFVETVHADFEPGSDTWARFARELERMQVACRENAARLLVAVFPLLVHLEDYALGAVHEHLLAELAKRGIPAVDLLPAFAGRAGSELWVHPIDQHPNAEGHALAAHAIAEFLALELGP